MGIMSTRSPDARVVLHSTENGTTYNDPLLQDLQIGAIRSQNSARFHMWRHVALQGGCTVFDEHKTGFSISATSDQVENLSQLLEDTKNGFVQRASNH